MSRAVLEVVPNEQAWVVRMPGDSVWEVLPNKAAAIHRARTLGARYDEWLVRVLAPNGLLETELRSSDRPSA